MRLPLMLLLLGTIGLSSARGDEPVIRQESSAGVTHGALAFGADTFLFDGTGKVLWTYPFNTRDGWALPNGRFLLVITKCDKYPGGGVVETDREGKVYFEYKGTQSETDGAQPLPDGHILLTESGSKPRLMEMDRNGKILVEIPLQCQTNDPHMETRMSRKLRNGHYLVPHLLDKVVKEYDRTGKVVWEVHTPNWPFSALRLDNGHTLISCTRGNLVIEVDKEGKEVWRLTNDDLPGAPLRDCCGMEMLPNGHIALTSYGAGGVGDVKLLEITPDKKLLWTCFTGQPHGVHEFQILDAQGRPLKGRLLR